MTQDLFLNSFRSKKKTRENKRICALQIFDSRNPIALPLVTFKHKELHTSFGLYLAHRGRCRSTLSARFSTRSKRLFPYNVTSGLYTIVCIKTGCVYVGESENVPRRLAVHKTKLRKNLHDNLKLQADFNQYGEAAFKLSRLYFGHGVDRNTRLDFETLILSTLLPNERYNVYSNWRKREGESNPFFGKKHSAESLAALSDAKKDKPSPFLGKKQSNYVKELISKHNANGGNRKKGLYIDDLFYESISEAFEITGTSRRIIRERCHSNEVRFAQYRWANPLSKIKDPAKSKTKGWEDECSEDIKVLLDTINENISSLWTLIASEAPKLQKKIVSSIRVQVEHFRTE